MRIRSKIVQWSSVLLLCSALLLPALVQFSHIFDRHQHKVCDDISTHVHEAALECFLCEYQPTPFDFTLEELPALYTPQPSFVPVIDVVPFSLDTYVLTNRQLRGPPVFS